ncbi:MAG: hypothetical protein WBO44_03435 [Saprospiraceae bacterium]|jgi:pimeloyl-ACP methyl ester carboxylesterase
MRNFILFYFAINLFNNNFLFSQSTQGSNTFNNNVGIGSSSNQSFVPNLYNNGTPATENDPTTDDERWVFWIHGLNGDLGTWARAKTASSDFVSPLLDPRKMKGDLADYADIQNGGTLFEAGAYVRDQWMETRRAQQLALGEDPTRNFMVCHSQGGVVGRATMHLDLCLGNKSKEDLAYGGLVTFGSPHQGARLLNNQAQFFDLADDLCKNLSAGPISENSILSFKIWIFRININIYEYIKDLVPKICESLTQDILPYLTAQQTPFITESYKVGAAQLQSINGCEDQELAEIPKVAFYGVEQKDGLMFRTLKYFNIPVGQSDYFMADPDQDVVDKFNDNYLKYVAKVEEHNAKYLYWDKLYKDGNCHTFFRYPSYDCKRIRTFRDYFLRNRQEFQKGVEVLSRLDDEYKKIIGALEFVRTQQLFCLCLNKNTNEESKTAISNPSQCITPGYPWICGTVTESTYSRVEKDSDGVVLAESASNLPGGITNGPTRLMDKSSHMQMRNDHNTAAKLKLLYNGEFDKFFKTAPK